MQHYSERLLLHVKRAEQATQAAKEAAVREVGITAAQQAALAVLSDNPGINTAELAHRCGMSQQAMNGLLSAWSCAVSCAAPRIRCTPAWSRSS